MRHIDDGLTDFFEYHALDVEDYKSKENRGKESENQPRHANTQGVNQQLFHFWVLENLDIVLQSHPRCARDGTANLEVLQGNDEAPDDRNVVENEIIHHSSNHEGYQDAVLFQSES